MTLKMPQRTLENVSLNVGFSPILIISKKLHPNNFTTGLIPLDEEMNS